MSGTWYCPECSTEVVDKNRRGPHLSGCRRSKNAKYLYMPGDGKHPHVVRKCPTCGESKPTRKEGMGFCSIACSKVGETNPMWRGDKASYLAFHGRVYYRYGKASFCTQCGKDTPFARYEWANLTGHYEDTEDYTSMCKPCHSRYDMARRKVAV